MDYPVIGKITGVKISSMARMLKKNNLPEKNCPVCHRSFTWRKKWTLVWDQVKYCSKRCRRAN